MKLRNIFKGLLLTFSVCLLLTACVADELPEITADLVTQDGKVNPTSSFTITYTGEITAEQLKERIHIEPLQSFSVEASEQEGVFLVKLLTTPLEAGSQLEFTFLDEDKAEIYNQPFEVANILMVDRVFPRDGATDVLLRSAIEISFNGEVSRDEFEGALKLNPPCDGNFEFDPDSGSSVFYPLGDDGNGFNENTTYTVTLDSLMAESGGKLEAPYSFSFTTGSESLQQAEHKFQNFGSDNSVNVLSDETPLIPFSIDDTLPHEEQNVDITVYQFESWEEYHEALISSDARRIMGKGYESGTDIETAHMQEVMQFESNPILEMQGDFYYDIRSIVAFPETIPEGWYVVDAVMTIDGHDVKRQMLLQSSDLSVFYMNTGENMLAWVNDVKTGKPVEGANIKVYVGEGVYIDEGVTAADGTANLTSLKQEKDEEEYSHYYANTESGGFVIEVGERVFVDSGDLQTGAFGEGAKYDTRDYYSYLFTDRPIYNTTDTLKFWGVVRPRDSAKTEQPKKVTVSLGEDIVTTEVEVLDNGTFIGEFSFENLAAKYWQYVNVKLDDITIVNQNVSIEDFVKPTHKFSATTDLPVYMEGVTKDPTISIEASLYDGTPASGIELEISRSASSTVTTDAKGKATQDVTGLTGENSWHPKSHNYSVGNITPLAENVYLYDTMYKIHRDLMLKGKVISETEVELTTNRISIENIKVEDDLWDRDNLKGDVVDTEIAVSLYKAYYIKEKTGTRYDFINRVSFDVFRYERHTELVENQTVTTKDGVYTLTELPKSTQDECYYLETSALDSQGRMVENQVYLGENYGRSSASSSGTNRYSLAKQTTVDYSAVDITDEYSIDQIIRAQRSRFTDNEDATFMLYNNDSPVEEMKGQILYSIVQRDFSNTFTTESNELVIDYSEANLPNYLLAGAYFDGKHIYALEELSMRFNPEERELEITLDTDKERYAPADEVRVKANVINKSTGQPAANTDIVLSVVDEAIFAIREQYVNLLDDLYDSVYYPIITSYASYDDMSYETAGEMGGGGGDDVRSDFQDTAWFGTARTDAQGNATFNYKLPDNITDWRLTSLALSDSTHAGNSTDNSIATKPYYVVPIVNETILEGDSFTVGLRSVGVDVAMTDAVDYKIIIKQGDTLIEEKDVTTTVDAQDYIIFNDLQIGEYTVQVEGVCKEFKDAVLLPFSVKKSGIEVSLVKTVDLKDGITVESMRYPVNLAIYDERYALHANIMNSVLSSSYGERTDMRIARTAIAKTFDESDAVWYDEEAGKDNFSDVRYSGSTLSLFPYSEVDGKLTALAYLAAPDLFKKNELKGFGATDNPYADLILGALAGEATLETVKLALDEGDDELNFVNRMYLSYALIVFGDVESAQAQYDSYVMPLLDETEGISGEKAFFIPKQENTDSLLDCTAAASVLATLLDTEHAELLIRYLTEKESKYEPYILEQLLYMERNQPPADSDSKFTYQLNGETITVDLMEEGMHYLSLNKEQLQNADFKVSGGDVKASVYYVGSPDDVADETNRKIGMNHEIIPLAGAFTTGSSVLIELAPPDFSALDTDIGGNNMIVDVYIPSGLRFERYERPEGSKGWVLLDREGQRLRFLAYGVGSSSGITPISFKARCALPGDYVVESIYINSSEGDTWGKTERGIITVN